MARAARIFDGQLHPTGRCDEWPLNQAHLNELRQTEQIRRRIRQGAIATRVAFVADVVIAVLLLFGIVLGVAATGGAGRSADVPAAVWIVFLAQIALAVLFFVAYKSTMQCRMWAPLTVAIIFTLNILCVLVALMAAAFANASPGPAFRDSSGLVLLIGFLFWITPPALIAALNYMAAAAIPKFLAQPAWCQEALLYCKL